MPRIYEGSWRLLWHEIRVHLDARAQRRAELIVMRAIDRHWHEARLRGLLKILIEKTAPAAEFSERRMGLRDHANDISLSRANGRGKAGNSHALMSAKRPAADDAVHLPAGHLPSSRRRA